MFKGKIHTVESINWASKPIRLMEFCDIFQKFEQYYLLK